MKFLLACTAGLMLSLHTPTAAAAESLNWPEWLAGSWCGGRGETRIEEVWLRAQGGLMLGMSRTAGPRRTEFEGLRIETQNGQLVYQAQPQGRPGVPFTLSAQGADFVEFTNPQHDFPQRIRYQRQGEQLKAEISGPGRDGKPKTIPFDYRACALNAGG